MTIEDLKNQIRSVLGRIQTNPTSVSTIDMEYDEVVRFPELKQTLIDLLSPEYNMFLASVDWVSPLPTTFRINLKNDQLFYLIFGKRSWIAQVEGKKYYLANPPEKGRAADAISRILRYGSSEEPSENNDGFEDTPPPTETPEETPDETPEA
jgi:hypothetical protein